MQYHRNELVAAVIEVSDQKRLYLTLSDKKREELKEWADQQGRPITNLATRLIETAIDKAKQSGEFKPTQQQNRTQINILDLQKLADQLEIPSDRLLKAIKEIKLEVINGGH